MEFQRGENWYWSMSGKITEDISALLLIIWLFIINPPKCEGNNVRSIQGKCKHIIVAHLIHLYIIYNVPHGPFPEHQNNGERQTNSLQIVNKWEHETKVLQHTFYVEFWMFLDVREWLEWPEFSPLIFMMFAKHLLSTFITMFNKYF